MNEIKESNNKEERIKAGLSEKESDIKITNKVLL